MLGYRTTAVDTAQKAPLYECKLDFEIRHLEAVIRTQPTCSVQSATLVDIENARLVHRVLKTANQIMRNRADCGSVDEAAQKLGSSLVIVASAYT